MHATLVNANMILGMVIGHRNNQVSIKSNIRIKVKSRLHT